MRVVQLICVSMCLSSAVAQSWLNQRCLLSTTFHVVFPTCTVTFFPQSAGVAAVGGLGRQLTASNSRCFFTLFFFSPRTAHDQKNPTCAKAGLGRSRRKEIEMKERQTYKSAAEERNSSFPESAGCGCLGGGGEGGWAHRQTNWEKEVLKEIMKKKKASRPAKVNPMQVFPASRLFHLHALNSSDRKMFTKNFLFPTRSTILPRTTILV